MKKIDLSVCKKGDILISSQGAKLEYIAPTPYKHYTYLDHVVKYIEDKDGKPFSKNNFGTRTNDGFVFLNNRRPETDHDIVEIIKIMREIKFRGKRIDNGEWVYGSLLEENHLGDIEYGISFYDRVNGVNKFVLIDESTIGQFTGLKDKNGVDIWEGDMTNFGEVIYEQGCFGIESEWGFVNLSSWNINVTEIIYDTNK